MWSTSAFSAVLHSAKQNSTSNDLFGAEVQHPALDTPVLITFREKDSLTPELITSRIEAIQQSKRDFQFDDEMLIKIVKITLPTGQGNRKIGDTISETFLKKHGGHGSSFIQIQNKDWKCIARAVVVGKAWIQSQDGIITQNQYKGIANCEKPRQLIKANELLEEAGIIETEDRKKNGCSLEELKAIQAVLTHQGYSLKVFSEDAFCDIIFDGGMDGGKYIYLYHQKNHFDVLKNPRPICGSNFWCDLCNKGYRAIDEHRCEKRCPGCRQAGKCAPDFSIPVITCQDCSRLFYSQTCFNSHKMSFSEFRHDTLGTQPPQKKQKLAVASLCDKIKKCNVCYRSVPSRHIKPEAHHCGQKQCHTCKEWVDNGSLHQCFVQPFKLKKSLGAKKNQKEPHNTMLLDSEEKGMFEEEHNEILGGGTGQFRELYFDFECAQEKHIGEDRVGEIMEHVPLLVHCMKICSGCKEFRLANCPTKSCRSRDCDACKLAIPKECKCDGEFHLKFKGRDCCNKFCDFLFQEKHKGLTAIAHNGKGTILQLDNINLHFLIFPSK